MTIEAFEPPPPNDLVRLWARVVLATLILIGVVGWWTAQSSLGLKLGMSAVTAVIEVWGFNAAVQWARALAREGVALPLIYWTINVVGCAWWTIFSIYHALGMIAADTDSYAMGVAATPAYVAFTCLALALPFHEWAIDRVERAPTKAHKPARSSPKPRPKSAPTTDRAPAHATPKRASSGRAALTVVTSAALLTMLNQAGLKPRDPAAFERAALIARENPGLTQDEIAERADVARQSLGRWMKAVPDAFRLAA